MFDTIFIGTSGLMAHAKGLRVVGNNLANVNTPGFKSSQLAFAEMFDQGGAGSRQNAAGSGTLGTGVDTTGSVLNFQAGADQASGSPLDLKIEGNGFYVVKREDELLYTRSGDFRFTDEGMLVNSNGDRVQALDANGLLADIQLDAFERSAPQGTSLVKVTGNLSATVATPPVNATLPSVKVIDAEGVVHTLKLSFQNTGGGVYTVSVSEGAGPVLGTGSLKFTAGFPVAGSDKFDLALTSAGGVASTISFDFAGKVTSLSGASTLGVASVDGYEAGVRADQSINADGTLVVHYSNGQKVDGPRLALANFDSDRDLAQVGGSAFKPVGDAVAQYGNPAGASFGTLQAGHREGSNVDLAEEFSNLILMQRGYQASSHVISTANDMIQQLFDMKGR